MSSAERRPYPLDAAVNHHEAVEFEKLEAIDDGLLADAGEPRDAVERRAHLAIAKGEAQEAFENPRHGARDALLAALYL
jgi:hypothetical protein